MSIQTINLGTYANDGTGDDLRTAFQKVNANFTQLFAEAAVINGTNLGAGAGIFKDKAGVNLEFKSLTSTDTSVVFTSSENTVNLSAKTRLLTDSHPQLGSDLDLNGYILGGRGDVQARIFGYDIQLLAATLELLIRSSAVNLDLGPIISNSAGNFDLNGQPLHNPLDFGTWTFGQQGPRNQLDFGTFA